MTRKREKEIEREGGGNERKPKQMGGKKEVETGKRPKRGREARKPGAITHKHVLNCNYTGTFSL